MGGKSHVSRYLLLDFFNFIDLELPYRGPIPLFGMRNQDDYTRDLQRCHESIDKYNNIKSNSSTIVILISMGGIVAIAYLVQNVGVKAPEALNSLIAAATGFILILIAASSQLILSIRSSLDDLIKDSERSRTNIIGKPRIQLLSVKTHMSFDGAMITGYLTNIGPVPCTVELPMNPRCYADLKTRKGGLFTSSNWVKTAESIKAAQKGIENPNICLNWHYRTTGGKNPPIRLEVGESRLVAIGFMWGTDGLKSGYIDAGFSASGGYGWWAKHEFKALQRKRPFKSGGLLRGEGGDTPTFETPVVAEVVEGRGAGRSGL